MNIATLARITLTDQLYISEIDLNGDRVFQKEERTTASYTFHLNGENKPYLTINNSGRIISLQKESTFDLLLQSIDLLGNEEILYLKK